jgi:cobalt-precorrin-5B (C1)-methyltransferase
MDVALAEGQTHLVLVPGNIGHKAVLRTLPNIRDNQVVEVSNEWGEMLRRCANTGAISSVTMGGHPGKLAKLIAGDWNTHSRYSESAVPVLLTTANELGIDVTEAPQTCQHVFDQLTDADAERLAGKLSVQITEAVLEYTGHAFDVRVFLFDMQGRLLGCNDQEVSDAE